MNWFNQLTGFKETTYAATRSQLEVHNNILLSKVNNQRYEIGKFELASVETLRARVASSSGGEGQARVQIVMGNVRRMHQAPEYTGALFQVASQFNALEMVSPLALLQRMELHVMNTIIHKALHALSLWGQQLSIVITSSQLVIREVRLRHVNSMDWQILEQSSVLD